MQNEPCRLLSDAHSAVNFIRANTVPATGKHPESYKPLVQLQAAEVKPKSVCICSYTARKDRYGQTYLVRNTEPKCQQHGSRATEE